jgi:hypothetical protein
MTGQFAYTFGLVSTMYQMLYQSLNQRWSANRGCFLMSVFSSKPSMQMRCYRVEYDCVKDIKKAT